MPIAIAIGAVVLAVVGWAIWPRKRGIVDGDVSRARRSSTGDVDSAITNIRGQYPIG